VTVLRTDGAAVVAIHSVSW